jgi:hypothetical protein
MEPINGIAADAAVTANDRCDMSCEVDNNELRFRFEDAGNGLQLAFAWRGFVRFMRVASAVIERLRATPPGPPIDFVVTAHADHNDDIITALRMTPDKDSTWSPTTCPSPPKSTADSGGTEDQHEPALGAFSYVTVNGNGTLTCEVLPNQIDLRFGDDNSGLHFFLNYQGFAKFLTVASNAVTRLQNLPDDTYTNFKVWDDEGIVTTR